MLQPKFQTSALLILLLLFTSFCGCKTGNAKLIVNKWRPVAVTAEISDSLKKVLFANTMIEFTKDGKCIVSGQQSRDTSDYTLSDNGTTLTISGGAKNQTVEMSIDTLTKDKIVFTTKMDGNSTTAVPVGD